MSKQNILIACLLATSVAHAQRLSFGVKGGAIVNEPTEHMKDESRRYTVGPVFEMRWGQISLEINLLYKRTGSRSHSLLAGRNLLPEEEAAMPSRRVRSHTWELPVLGKYYFRRESRLQPFVSTGYSFSKSKVAGEGTFINFLEGQPKPLPYNFNHWTELNIGAVVAAGVQWRAGRFALTPEFRYTRWSSRQETSLKRNQIEVLFGITY